MAVKIIKDIVPIDGRYRSGKKLRKFKGITIHETGNFAKNSNAKAHNTFFHNIVKNNNYQQISYHYFVDDKECYLELPTDEVAWTCGDGGNGTGNNETVSVEICVNPECNFDKARDNAGYVTALELFNHGIKTVVDGLKDKANGNVFQHYSWTKKNCPMVIRRDGKWDKFLVDTQIHLNKLWGVSSKKQEYQVRVWSFGTKDKANAAKVRIANLGYYCEVEEIK